MVATGAYEGMADLADPRAVPFLKEGSRYGKPRRQREAEPSDHLIEDQDDTVPCGEITNALKIAGKPGR